MSIDPEHVEAVREVIADIGMSESEDELVSAGSKRLLTSTDPAVHTALLAALVRAGVLMDEVAPGHILVGAEGGDEEWRRYVTEWEVL